MINVDKLSITSIETVTSFDNAGVCQMMLDELTQATIANTEEKTDITGKGGRKIGSIKKNKGVKVTGTNGVISGGLMANQLGTTVQSGTDGAGVKTKTKHTDIITVTSNAGATAWKAVGTAGNEIGTLFLKNADGTLGKKFTQVAATPTTGTFTYTPATKALTFFASDITDGAQVVAFYDRQVLAKVISNVSDLYSKTLRTYVDCLATDTCNNIYRVQYIIPRADFSGNFSTEMGDKAAVHAWEFEGLAGGCAGNSDLWDMIIFGVNDADAI